MTISIKLLAFIILALLYTCTNPQNEQSPPFNIKIAGNLALTVPEPNYNKATLAGVKLGRLLFYDPLLSGNNTVSCASCHFQQKAFSGAPEKFSKGVSDIPQLRNTPALFNLAWAGGYFWDGGATNLESQVFAPLQSPDEMNQDLKELAKELQQIPAYTSLFEQAFGSDSITSSKIARAIAQFERSLISDNSRYDKYIRKEDNVVFNEQEIKGLRLFTEKCATCHKPGFFTDFSYHNNGLDSIFDDDSHERLYKGRYRITENIDDIGKYKTPSLRNVALTAPYMHDGRFATIQEVIEHYSNNIKTFSTLNKQLNNQTRKGFQFTTEEKTALVVFLQTLTDDDFISNTAFTNPRKY